MKGIRVTEITKDIKFKGDWGELEPKQCFRRQSIAKYWRLTLVFMGSSELREKFNFCFTRFYARINKISSSAGGLCGRLSFNRIEALSSYFLLS